MKHDVKSIKPLKDLNLTDRFLFDMVMEDLQTQQDVLSIIFGRDIPLLSQGETEKEFRVSPSVRSIRMDVFSMDEEKAVYNTEMQQKQQSDLARRSRYYQSMLDTSLLEPGVPDYSALNPSYIIMIAPFDLFGYGRYVYTFRATCQEEPGCILYYKQIRKKLAKGLTAAEIADMLEESEDKIRHMAETIESHPEMDEKELLEVL